VDQALNVNSLDLSVLGDTPILVIFDGTCGFCTRVVRLAGERAGAGRVAARPNQEPGVIERYGLTRADVDRFVWVVEPSGRRLRGAAAVARVLREMGGWWRPLGWLASLPGAGLGYALVARLRPRLSAAWGDRPPYED
jgi:predicted DCC family thiol-disulfide oxidoreductase YuxK